MDMSGIASFFTAVFVLVTLLVGCAPAGELPVEVTPLPTVFQVEICTERDCGPTLSVRLDGKVPETYIFKVTTANDASREVRCVNGSGDYGPNHFDSMSYLECHSFGVQFVNFAPDEMMITIDWGDGNYSEMIRPDYRLFYPNGLDCPPECRSGSVTITIPDPAGGL